MNDRHSIIGGVVGTVLTTFSLATLNEWVTLACGIATLIVTVPAACRKIKNLFAK